MGTTESTSAHHPTALPAGDWQVVPARSELGFHTRIAFGLIPVRGKFSGYDGDLHVDGAGNATGSMRIEAATIRTGIKKRDTHLLTSEFFAADEHPQFRFELAAIAPAAGDARTVTGTLHIRDKALPIESPVSVVEIGPDALRLEADVKVDHRASGLGWKAPENVRVRAALVLERTG